MISHPGDFLITDFTEGDFISDVFKLLRIVVPWAFWFALWRVSVTNQSGPRADLTFLGLDPSSPTYSEPDRPYVSMLARISYCVVSGLTFFIGLLLTELHDGSGQLQ